MRKLLLLLLLTPALAQIPVQQQVVVMGVAGSSLPNFSVAPPGSPVATASTASGTLGAGQYSIRTTYTTASGETLPSASTLSTLTAAGNVVVTSPPSSTGATSYNVYIGTTVGTETKQGNAIAIGTSFTQSAALSAGAALPSYTLVPLVASTGGILNTTSSGGAGSNQVQGTAAAGSAPVGNPVQIGGSDGTNMRTLATASNGVIALGPLNAASDGVGNGAVVNPLNPGGSGGGTIFATGGWQFNGSTWDRSFYCPNTVTFSVAATTTQVVAISGTTKIRVCSFVMSGNATAGSMALVQGTGSNCATGQTSLSGTVNVLGTTAPPVTFSPGASGALTSVAGNAVCVLATTTTASGSITYAQF